MVEKVEEGGRIEYYYSWKKVFQWYSSNLTAIVVLAFPSIFTTLFCWITLHSLLGTEASGAAPPSLIKQ